WTFNTAPPFDKVNGKANNNTTATNARDPGVPYNSQRGDSYNSFDLRTSKKFVFKESKNIEVLWEMFNVFNTQNLIQYNSRADPSNLATFGQPTSALDAFQGQFGLKFTF